MGSTDIEKSPPPVFSVIVPTYKRPRYLKRAIHDVLKQSMQDFELIVVDSDSGEGSAIKTVQLFSDTRITYIQRETPGSPAKTRNTGAQNAKGAYLAFLDDDDEWSPETLQNYYDVIKKHNYGVHYLFSPVINTFEDGRAPRVQKRTAPEGLHDFLDGFLALNFRALTSALVVKTNTFWGAGGFDEQITCGEEWELCIRLAKNHKGYFLDKPLVRRTIVMGEHAGGGPGKKAVGREAVIHKHIDLFEKRPPVLSQQHYLTGALFQQAGNIRKAQKHFWKAWRYNRKRIDHLARLCASLLGKSFYSTIKKDGSMSC